VGWRTRDDAFDRASWQQNPRPSVRFFLQENPGYSEGQGLVTMISLAPRTLAATAWRLASDRLRRLAQRWAL
jgi:hypothetical protein